MTIVEKAPAERHMISSWEQVSVAPVSPHLPTKGGQLKCPQEGTIDTGNLLLPQAKLPSMWRSPFSPILFRPLNTLFHSMLFPWCRAPPLSLSYGGSGTLEGVY